MRDDSSRGKKLSPEVLPGISRSRYQKLDRRNAVHVANAEKRALEGDVLGSRELIRIKETVVVVASPYRRKPCPLTRIPSTSRWSG